MTKKSLQRLPLATLTVLCRRVADCPGANAETVKRAKELVTDLVWASQAVPSKQQPVRNRAVEFLLLEQAFWT
jgi:hypothetical protein